MHQLDNYLTKGNEKGFMTPAQNSQQGSDGGQQKPESDPMKFVTPFGILEEDFVRTAKAEGKYCPTIHELDTLRLERKITPNEDRLLTYIKTKTVYFRDTHIRIKRRTLSEQTQIAKPNLIDAIHSLLEKKYLLEKRDTDDYYFYALDPRTFKGTIVLRSKAESLHRLNRGSKKHLPKASKGSEKLPSWKLKATDKVANYYREDEASIRNYSSFETLKYTLLKYTLLNGISSLKSQEVVDLFGSIQNPEYMIKQFTTLVQKQPSLSRGIVEELLRAHREGKDAHGYKIKSHALAYLITSWDQVKHYWQNLDHKIDMSLEAVSLRKEFCELIQEYPIESNVVSFKKVGS